ncbi:MAG: hypothetical protein HYV09_25055 [Deltaproteobacteria bacterium]|nr:hypothetical protein [Deltaproteobacteria bacterium]
MRRLLVLKSLAMVLVSCGVERPPATPARPAPTEEDACARVCEQLGECAIAPMSCAPSCARDQARLRPGVQPAFASCLERELVRCDARPIADRRQLVSLCWTATLEGWSKEAGKAAITEVVRAVCERAARCEPGTESVDECATALASKLRDSPQGKTLAVARPELVTGIATCVRDGSCAEPHPVAACAAASEKEP